jgi:group I intron endonuclease
MGCIYVISNKINNKQYVGQAKNFKQRKQRHLYNTWNDNKKTRSYHMAIHRAIRKYGEDAFTWEILEDNIPNEKMNELEMKYIAKLDTFNSGYNSNTGGSSSFGYRHDAETRKRMSISAKNKPPVSDATRERLSKAKRGRTHSKETLAKMRAVLNSSEVKARRVNTLRENKKGWLAVDQYTKTGEFIASYDSLVIACEKTGVHVSSICDVLKGRYLAAGGFIWTYKNAI